MEGEFLFGRFLGQIVQIQQQAISAIGEFDLFVRFFRGEIFIERENLLIAFFEMHHGLVGCRGGQYIWFDRSRRR